MPWTMEGEFNTYLTDARDGGVAPSFGEARFDPSRKYVRVNGERQGLVEFDFGVGDLTLSVEMMLSHEDFQRFCRSEEHTSELQSLMRISYAVFCLKKKKKTTHKHHNRTHINYNNKQSETH